MKYRTESGEKTTADDPKRVLWYSSRCGYWTDDWDKLTKVGPGIPACPHCQAVGFQTTAENWDRGIDAYEAQDPGYKERLKQEQCSRKGA